MGRGESSEVLTTELRSRGQTTISAGALACSEPADSHPERNEDSLLVSDDQKFAVVLDGISGGGGGDQISQAAVRGLELAETDRPSADAELYEQAMWLKGAFALAQKSARQMMKAVGQGTTVVLSLRVSPTELLLISAGDSRAYAVSKRGKLRRLTIDDKNRAPQGPDDPVLHSELDEANSSKQLSEYGKRAFRSRNIVSSELLSAPELQPYLVTLNPDDRLLLTTDGVHDNLTTIEIEKSLQHNSASVLAARARERAREGSFRSKDDDITCVLLPAK